MDKQEAIQRCADLASRRREAASLSLDAAQASRERADDLTGDRRDLLLGAAAQHERRAGMYQQDAEAIEELLKWI